jgi:hypothetical protein
MLRKHLLVGKRCYMGVRYSVSILMNRMMALTFIQASFLQFMSMRRRSAIVVGSLIPTFRTIITSRLPKPQKFTIFDPDDDAVLDFARYWGSRRGCAQPYRAQTKGKVESRV